MIQSKEVDVNSFRNNKVVRTYPYIEILEFNDTLPLVLQTMESGRVQIQATHKGVTKIVGSISHSAYNIDKLLRTNQKIQLWLTKDKCVQISSVQEYLEVI